MSLPRWFGHPVPVRVVGDPIMGTCLARRATIPNGHVATVHLPVRALCVTTTHIVEALTDLKPRFCF